MKYLLCGDLHFGAKQDSEKHNQRVIDFLKWACTLKEKYKLDTFVQFGDYFDSRNKINVSTLNYGIEGAKILRDNRRKRNIRACW